MSNKNHISGSDEEDWVACKKDLYENLVKKCGPAGIQKVLQDCLLQGQAQLVQRVVFRFSTLRLTQLPTT